VSNGLAHPGHCHDAMPLTRQDLEGEKGVEHWPAVTIVVLALVRVRLAARVVPFFIHCCPSRAVGLYTSLDRRRATYASIRGTRSGVSPLHWASHRASSPSGMVDVLHPAIGKGDVMEDLRVSP
jgi:hypothetical protein